MLFLCILSILLITTEAHQIAMHYNVSHNTDVGTDYMAQYKVRSRRECVKVCQTSNGCKHAKMRNSMCYLLSEVHTNGFLIVTDPDTVYMSKYVNYIGESITVYNNYISSI